MQIICPHCGFEKDTSNTVIPAHATTATCPKCKEKFTFRSFDVEKEVHEPEIIEKRPLSETKNLKNEDLTEEELIEKAHSAYREQMQYSENISNENAQNIQLYVAVPWEDEKSELTYISKFLQTITRVLFSPVAFFATMNRVNSVQKALIFYVIIGLIEFVARTFLLRSALNMSVDESALSSQLLAAVASPEALFMGLCIAPPLLIFKLLFYTSIISLMIRFLDPEKADFYLTLRMLSYASAPSILCLIPVIGDIVAFPWIMFNIYILSRYGLRVSFINSSGSVFSKIVFCILAFIIFILGMSLFSSSLLNSLMLYDFAV